MQHNFLKFFVPRIKYNFEKKFCCLKWKKIERKYEKEFLQHRCHGPGPNTSLTFHVHLIWVPYYFSNPKQFFEKFFDPNSLNARINIIFRTFQPTVRRLLIQHWLAIFLTLVRCLAQRNSYQWLPHFSWGNIIYSFC